MTGSQASKRCHSLGRCMFTRTPVRATRETRLFPNNCAAATLEAYARGRHLLGLEYVSDGKFEPAVERLFAHEQVDYIQVHSTAAGCFTFRIERSDRPVTASP